MKSKVVLGRIVKVAAVVIITATITWQARTQQEAMGNQPQGVLNQQAGMIPRSLAEFRKAQVQELTRTMPNRFALSKAYYGIENALLESVELEHKNKEATEQVLLPKS